MNAREGLQSNKCLYQNENIDHQQPIQSLRQQQENRHDSDHEAKHSDSQWLDIKTKLEEKANRYYKGRKITLGQSLGHFKIYGEGIYLYFSFHKKLLIFFLLLSLISLIPIVYNYANGENYDNIDLKIQTYLGKTTIGSNLNTSTNNKTAKFLNLIPQIICLLSAFAFYLYWDRKSATISQEIGETIKLPSKNTIVIQKFDQDMTEERMISFMNRLGKSKEIVTVRKQTNVVLIGKEIKKMQDENEILEDQFEIDHSEAIKNQIKSKQLEIQELKKSLEEEKYNCDKTIIRFYVTFETAAQAEEIIKFLESHNKLCCSEQYPDDLQPQAFHLQAKACHTEPYGMFWENTHKNWKEIIPKAILDFILINGLSVAAFILLAIFLVSTPPLLYAEIDTSSYTPTSIANQLNQTIVFSWCMKQEIYDREFKKICNSAWERFGVRTTITVLVALTILFLKMLMKKVVIAMKRFQRPMTQSELSTQLILHLFISYTMFVGFIILTLQSKMFGNSFKNIIRSCIADPYLIDNLSQVSDYPDYTSQWYIDVGYQMILTFFILALFPHLLKPLQYFILEKINDCRAKRSRSTKVIQTFLEKNEFEIEDSYANIIYTFFLAFLFGAGIPILFPIAFLSCLVQYLVNKYVFIRFCKRPLPRDSLLNSHLKRYFLLAIVGFYVHGTWMLGQQNIFSSSILLLEDKGINANSNASGVGQALAVFIRRAAENYYFTIAFAFGFIVIMIKDLVVKIFSGELHSSQQTEGQQNKIFGMSFPPLKLGKSNAVHNQIGESSLDQDIQLPTFSYKMENNAVYREIMQIITKESRLACQSNIIAT